MNLSPIPVIVFEDENFGNFFPITLSRPTYDIRSGTRTNLDRIRHHFGGDPAATICRPYLRAAVGDNISDILKSLADSPAGKMILINGSVFISIIDLEFINELKGQEDFVSYIRRDKLLAAVIPSKHIKDLIDAITHLYEKDRAGEIIAASARSPEVNVKSFSYIWEPMLENPEIIKSDFEEYYKDAPSSNGTGDSFVYGTENIRITGKASMDSASVIDSREGPVIIESGVEIKPFCYLEGPAYIGRDCRLVGGKVTGGCSFGPDCRIGGEVENTIMIGFSNKYHEGFLGHAYLGEWVNLGALTTNSDLKNNYTEISVKQNGRVVRTGSIKIGSFMGDHSKTGIGMTLNTGAVIGFSCNLFGGSLLIEREIPSFAWGNDRMRHEYSLEKAIQTADIVCQRRSVIFDDYHRNLFENIFEMSRQQRRNWAQGKRIGN
jgi:UDP-N-acetylglucosamine diphosphorylase/glucosamine-1-phosphate N-acetyltransferase